MNYLTTYVHRNLLKMLINLHYHELLEKIKENEGKNT